MKQISNKNLNNKPEVLVLNLKEIKDILNCEVIACESKLETTRVDAVGAADMMSEVLAYSHEHAVLLTGLITPQVVRTAQMMDLSGVVFVRGKIPQEDTVTLAKELEIPLLVTKDLLYTACGKLYEKGIPSC